MLGKMTGYSQSVSSTIYNYLPHVVAINRIRIEQDQQIHLQWTFLNTKVCTFEYFSIEKNISSKKRVENDLKRVEIS